MTSADEMRASDADREKVVHALQEQVGEGRLTLAEFEERSGQAYEAKTVGELRVLFKDLPFDPLAPPAQQFGMPAVPPWAARQFPPYPRQALPPMRRGSPAGAVVMVVLGLLLVQGALIVATHVFIPFLPVLLLFLFLRPHGRRYR